MHCTLTKHLYVLLICIGLYTSSIEAKTYALVIGINKYRHETPLSGAVNDANDIAKALQESGVNTQKLLDYHASKQAIKLRWERIVRSSKPGDILVVSYAGHGAQIPDLNHDERDGTDEVFILSQYNKRSKTARQNMISDDEWGEWFSQAKGRTILFLVDSCHSGTADKGSLANKFKQRSIKIPAPQPIYADRIGKDRINNNVLIISATTANRSIYEVLIDGNSRGALSWAFATAIRGKADINRNNLIEKAELERFVRTAVQKINHGQTPIFQPRNLFTYQKIFNSGKRLKPSNYQLSIVLTRINYSDYNISLYGNKYPYLTLYNITQQGIIQLLHPYQKYEEYKQIRNNYNLKLKLDRKTLGNDELIAIFSQQPQERLNTWLNDWNQQKAYHALQVNRPSLMRGKYEEEHLRYNSR